MDLKQRKLNKSEWDTIEVPVSQNEKEILDLIVKGFHDVNIKYNKVPSLLSFLKIEHNETMEDYLYNKYFSETINKLIKKYEINFIHINVKTDIKLKTADKIRLEKNTNQSIEKETIYEVILIELIEKVLKHYNKSEKSKWQYNYFTITKLLKNQIKHINRHIIDICKKIIKQYEDEITLFDVVSNSVEFIEKNDYLLKYSDMTLYQHQKDIFTISQNLCPKLVLYIAPTGTGKTLTPLGLSEKYKVIFVCAARHVGLALARAAISINKKIAFAFGCASSGDIRLHYFAAKEITKNWKTGGIWKVDNSIGDKVEIMICDIKSYLPAMYYMLSFNTGSQIITYWDEPTITLDYSNHEFHEIINKNWKENLIPNMVLSSATLPKIHELPDTCGDFRNKFEGAEIYNIVSHDCKKSIPLVDKNGYVVLPHYITNEYKMLQEIISHCDNYLTLLRYFDLNEIVEFIKFVYSENIVKENSKVSVNRSFETINEIDMMNIKLYYIKVLKSIKEPEWKNIVDNFVSKKQKKIIPNQYIDAKGNKIDTTNKEYMEKLNGNNGDCGLYMTTKDAFTLTDGPTIFLAKDIEKIAGFCVKQANIPSLVMNDIMEKINFNNTINLKIEKLERNIEDINEKNGLTQKESDDGKKKKNDKKINRQDSDNIQNKELRELNTQIELLRNSIKISRLNDIFVPNTSEHIKKWSEQMNPKKCFKCDIEDSVINKIMLLKDVEDTWKVLLLMGIGVFTNHESIEYTEIMKNLADSQKLYMIIASSDYIYGTNYQFCHGYLSKDMDLTQEKIIQALGRIGRNNVQQNYTIRFRDEEQLIKLFTKEADKPEINNMNKLFNS